MSSQLPTVPSVSGSHDEPEAPAVVVEPPALVRPSILIVDDEASIADALHDLLLGEGFAVALAQDGRRGLAELLKAPPTLLLTDYMMPSMDGISMLEEVRANPSLQALPVVMMSAMNLADSPRSSLWNHFLAKPFGVEQLLATIRRLVPGLDELRRVSL